MGQIVRAIGTVILAAGTAFFVTIIISIVVWPGEAQLTAPLFCNGDRVSTEVIREFAPGSSGILEYSLRCIDAAGNVDDAGALRPLLALGALHTALLIPVVIVSDRRGWARSYDSAAHGDSFASDIQHHGP